MLTLGLTGGVASGKSLAAKFFTELSAMVLDADRAGHEVLREPAVRDALIKRWGPKMVNRSGEVDRAAVAKLVFGGSPETDDNRRFLEQLLHPLIRARLEEERTRGAAQGRKVFILDAPLLVESGWDATCDRVVFVDASWELRLRRAAARGWTAEQFAQREAAQWPVEQKRQRSDWMLTNDDSPEELRKQVNALWRKQVVPLVSSHNREDL